MTVLQLNVTMHLATALAFVDWTEDVFTTLLQRGKPSRHASNTKTVLARAVTRVHVTSVAQSHLKQHQINHSCVLKNIHYLRVMNELIQDWKPNS